MTFGELKAKIKGMVKASPLKSVTLHDRGVQEYVNGYNKAIEDILELIENMKKSNNGNK
jgi:hypothetical protein